MISIRNFNSNQKVKKIDLLCGDLNINFIINSNTREEWNYRFKKNIRSKQMIDGKIIKYKNHIKSKYASETERS